MSNTADTIATTPHLGTNANREDFLPGRCRTSKGFGTLALFSPILGARVTTDGFTRNLSLLLLLCCPYDVVRKNWSYKDLGETSV